MIEVGGKRVKLMVKDKLRVKERMIMKVGVKVRFELIAPNRISF